MLKKNLFISLIAFVAWLSKPVMAQQAMTREDDINPIYRFLKGEGNSPVTLPPQLAAALVTQPEIKPSENHTVLVRADVKHWGAGHPSDERRGGRDQSSSVQPGASDVLSVQLRFTNEPHSQKENFSFSLQMKYWKEGKPEDITTTEKFPLSVMSFSGEAMYFVSPVLLPKSYATQYWMDHIPLEQLNADHSSLSRVYLHPFSGKSVANLKRVEKLWFEEVKELDPQSLECLKPYEHVVDAFKKTGAILQYGQLICENQSDSSKKRAKHYTFAQLEFLQDFKSLRKLMLCESTAIADTDYQEVIPLSKLPGVVLDKEVKGPCQAKLGLHFEEPEWEWEHHELKEKVFEFQGGLRSFLKKE